MGENNILTALKGCGVKTDMGGVNTQFCMIGTLQEISIKTNFTWNILFLDEF